MSIGIYKIENLINGSIYIGQSRNIEQRWKNHKNVNQNDNEYNYPLYRAFRKYGVEFFSFSILEECLISELNEKELYWIDYYDSCSNGYNQTIGGTSVSFNSITPKILNEITELLKNTNKTTLEIANIYNVSHQEIGGINSGRMWKRDIKYPIRDIKKLYCSQCNKKITRYSDTGLCQECYNISKRKTERPEPLQLAQEILALGFEGVGRKYGVTGNAIKKWCETYNMGRLKSEIAIWYANNKND